MSGVELDRLWHWFGLAGLLCASAFFSGSETALFSLSRHELRQLGSSPSRLRRLPAELMRQPRRVLLTILIANMTVNVLIFADSYVLFERLAGQISAGLASAGGAAALLVVIIFGEVIPKAVAFAGATRVAPLVAPVIGLCQQVLTPVRVILDGLVVEPLTRLLSPGPPSRAVITVEELKLLVETSQRRGIIGQDESALLQQVVELGRVRVRQVMVPRVDIRAFDIDGQAEQLREMMRRQRLKKVPVYQDNIDKIVGLVYAKQLFLDGSRGLGELVRPVNFVPEQMRLDQLLQHFRDSRTQLAIVVDEYGGTAGLVTLEDVLEHIVGQIEEPERPPKPPPIEQLDERSFLVAGGLGIHEWTEAFGVRLADERISTLGGLVLARLGRIPQPNDRVRIGNVQLTVTRMRGARVEQLKVELLDPQDSGEARSR